MSMVFFLNQALVLALNSGSQPRIAFRSFKCWPSMRVMACVICMSLDGGTPRRGGGNLGIHQLFKEFFK